MSIKDITVIIATFKSDIKVINCLNSINKECNVIIVENSNNVSFKKSIEKKYSNVECILTGNNFGYGYANNVGLKNVKTKFALILNPDVLLSNFSLENFLKATSLVNDFAILAPKEQNHNLVRESISENKIVLTSTESVKGFAMFFNLSNFVDIGFFDERFFLYFEDIDLCKRITNKGKKIFLVSNLQIKHLGAQSSSEDITWNRELTRNWHWMWSTFFYHKKYKGFLISFFIVLPKLISSIFKIVIYSFALNKKKKAIYFMRFSGLVNAIKGKNSWQRPDV